VRAETALFHSRVHGLKAGWLADQVRSYAAPFADFSFPTHITDKSAHSESE